MVPPCHTALEVREYKTEIRLTSLQNNPPKTKNRQIISRFTWSSFSNPTDEDLKWFRLAIHITPTRFLVAIYTIAESSVDSRVENLWTYPYSHFCFDISCNPIPSLRDLLSSLAYALNNISPEGGTRASSQILYVEYYVWNVADFWRLFLRYG